MPQHDPPQKTRSALRAWLSVACACLLAWFAWTARHDLVEMVANCNPVVLGLAVVMGIAFTVTQGSLFAWLLAKQGARNSARDAIAAFLVSQPGKYVPGKIWSPLMQSIALKNGSAFGPITIANVELALIALVQVSALGMACLQARSPAVVTAIVAAATVACVLIGVLPTARIVASLAPRLSSLMRLNPAPTAGGRPLPAMLICLAGLASNFVASFLVLYAAGASIPTEALLPVLAALYLGFAASILAIPVPAGIGIREFAAASLGHILAPGVPTTTIVSAALLFRCWQIIVDVACLGLGLLLAHRSRN